MTPIMWWGLIASDFLAKPTKLASRWRHNFSLVPELQMYCDLCLALFVILGLGFSSISSTL
jgi:hypothetical protein